jgi:prepilin-type processing-associated H-X9-DG protein/prepilin-type N-terminal cleavage/methylation domain-containing protein
MSNTVDYLFGRQPLRRANRGSGGFSLVELLVTIGVIALLAGIILGVLSKARESARQVSCFNNLRAISHAIMMYVEDNENAFPANAGLKPPNQDQDWLWWQSTAPTPPSPAVTMRISQINLHGIGKYLDSFNDQSTRGLQVLRCPSDARLQNKGFLDFAPNGMAPPMAYPSGYPFSYVMNGFMCSGIPADTTVLTLFPINNGVNPTVRTMTAVKEAANKIMVYEEDGRTIDDGYGLLVPNGPKTETLSLRHSGFDDLQADSSAWSDGSKTKDPINITIMTNPSGPQVQTLGNASLTGNVAFCDGHVAAVDRATAHSKDHWAPDAAINALLSFP